MTDPRAARMRGMDRSRERGRTGRAWGGGEAAAMRRVRDHLRGPCGLAAEAVSVLGYWKHRDTDRWE